MAEPKQAKFIHRRKHIRFKPDALAHAEISFELEDEDFIPQFIALIVEEAPLGGCGLIALPDTRYKVGEKLRVKVGKIHPLLAEISWVKDLGSDAVRLGLKFLE